MSLPHPSPKPTVAVVPTRSVKPTESSLTTPGVDSGAQSADSNINAGSSSGISNGIKIGIIVGITVVVILTLIAVGFCMLDGRRRVQKWKEKRQQRRDSELNMWETELRDGRSKRRESKPGGLWDSLRIDNSKQPPLNDLANPQKDPTLDRYERRLQSVGMWERIGEMRSEASKADKDDIIAKDNIAERQVSERDSEWLPTYTPRDRASIVSSVGSLGIPVVGPPVVARNFLDREDGR